MASAQAYQLVNDLLALYIRRRGSEMRDRMADVVEVYLQAAERRGRETAAKEREEC
jgi:hypothetical protein